MGRVLYVINPNASQAVTDGIAQALAPLHGPVPIRCLTLAEGPPAIETDADIAAVAAPLTRQAAALAEDAAGLVIACFSDPGVPALRAAAACPVVGIGTAAYLQAVALAPPFGVISILPASIPRHADAIAALGLSRHCAGDRALGLGVAELADRARTLPRLIDTAAQLRADGARCLILGCAGMAWARAPLAAASRLPVIDPCQAGTALALSQIALGLAPVQQESAHAR